MFVAIKKCAVIKFSPGEDDVFKVFDLGNIIEVIAEMTAGAEAVAKADRLVIKRAITQHVVHVPNDPHPETLEKTSAVS
mgnify:CR=1 FL=1